jgi:hypothetical protein
MMDRFGENDNVTFNLQAKWGAIMKGKGKVVPELLLTEHHVMRAYLTPRERDSGTRWAQKLVWTRC